MTEVNSLSRLPEPKPIHPNAFRGKTASTLLADRYQKIANQQAADEALLPPPKEIMLPPAPLTPEEVANTQEIEHRQQFDAKVKHLIKTGQVTPKQAVFLTEKDLVQRRKEPTLKKTTEKELSLREQRAYSQQTTEQQQISQDATEKKQTAREQGKPEPSFEYAPDVIVVVCDDLRGEIKQQETIQKLGEQVQLAAQATQAELGVEKKPGILGMLGGTTTVEVSQVIESLDTQITTKRQELTQAQTDLEEFKQAHEKEEENREEQRKWKRRFNESKRGLNISGTSEDIRNAANELENSQRTFEEFAEATPVVGHPPRLIAVATRQYTAALEQSERLPSAKDITDVIMTKQQELNELQKNKPKRNAAQRQLVILTDMNELKDQLIQRDRADRDLSDLSDDATKIDHYIGLQDNARDSQQKLNDYFSDTVTNAQRDHIVEVAREEPILTPEEQAAIIVYRTDLGVRERTTLPTIEAEITTLEQQRLLAQSRYEGTRQAAELDIEEQATHAEARTTELEFALNYLEKWPARAEIQVQTLDELQGELQSLLDYQTDTINRGYKIDKKLQKDIENTRKRVAEISYAGNPKMIQDDPFAPEALKETLIFYDQEDPQAAIATIEDERERRDFQRNLELFTPFFESLPVTTVPTTQVQAAAAAAPGAPRPPEEPLPMPDLKDFEIKKSRRTIDVLTTQSPEAIIEYIDSADETGLEELRMQTEARLTNHPNEKIQVDYLLNVQDGLDNPENPAELHETVRDYLMTQNIDQRALQQALILRLINEKKASVRGTTENNTTDEHATENRNIIKLRNALLVSQHLNEIKFSPPLQGAA